MAIDNSRYRDELLDIAEKVNNAYTLLDAVEEVDKHYKLLDKDFIFVIRSIVQTGIASSALDELSEDYKEQLLAKLITLPEKNLYSNDGYCLYSSDNNICFYLYSNLYINTKCSRNRDEVIV